MQREIRAGWLPSSLCCCSEFSVGGGGPPLFLCLVVDLDDVKVHLARARVAVMLNLRADALRGSRAAHCLSTNWCYSSPIDTATPPTYKGGPLRLQKSYSFRCQKRTQKQSLAPACLDHESFPFCNVDERGTVSKARIVPLLLHGSQITV